MDNEESQTRTYLDFMEMVDAIAAHTNATGDHVLPADSPPHLGYVAVRYATESAPERAVLFQIHTSNIGPSLTRYESVDDPSGLRTIKAGLLRQAIQTSAGRLRLAVSFPGQAIDQPGGLESQQALVAQLKSDSAEPTSTPE